MEITGDSDALICLIYKTYLEKRKNGIDKLPAKSFENVEKLQETVCPKFSINDTSESCRELMRAGLLTGHGTLDGSILLITISDKGIIYMENRFPGQLSNVLDYLAKIKNSVPFL